VSAALRDIANRQFLRARHRYGFNLRTGLYYPNRDPQRSPRSERLDLVEWQ